ncbi:phospholipase D-like domain-containing protein, partial [Aeromonas simiae]|uniref:phospholipase D-like domain-containing protein n=1 Tax=Aeromonas simiae TaxID=218936 RepID=UPI001E41DFC3
MEAVECSLLTEPEAALAWRRALIRQARHAIDAQYYSWAEDDSGSQLLAELLAAARRGVQVRLLVDDMYVVTSGWLALLAGEPNVAVRLFNPFRFRLWRPLALLLEILLRFRRLNHRMHNKLLLIDGRLAIIGGRNIGDSYFDRAASTAFIDLDLLCRGILCRQLEQGFVRFWRSRWSRSLLRLHPEVGTMSADERALRCAVLLPLAGREGEP